MKGKLFGGIMLIVGTTIGAGILDLPIVMGDSGFLASLGLIFLCWFIMTSGALLLMEACFFAPPHSNLVSIANLTLGKFGKFVAWIVYLLLLYVLLCAYISGGSDLIAQALGAAGIHVSGGAAAVLFAFVFGGIVYKGVVWIDWSNRTLVFFNLCIFALIIALLVPFVHIDYLVRFKPGSLLSSVTVAVTSFAFSFIIPSLRTYLDNDLKLLRRCILIGTTIPLVLYTAWVVVVQGGLPAHGVEGLAEIQKSSGVASHLSLALIHVTQYHWFSVIIETFEVFCMLTSFLGVGLSLSDFLADGFSINRQENALGISVVAFLPPLMLVMFWQNLFVQALHYAGFCCIVLLILLPALMVYSGRYIKKTNTDYRVFGGRTLLFVLIVFSIIALVLDLMY